MTNEALANEIEREGIERVLYGKGHAALVELNERLVTALRANAAPQGWIPVSERLPLGDDSVLAASEKNMHVKPAAVIRNSVAAAKREGDAGFYTHWMPLHGLRYALSESHRARPLPPLLPDMRRVGVKI